MAEGEPKAKKGKGHKNYGTRLYTYWLVSLNCCFLKELIMESGTRV